MAHVKNLLTTIPFDALRDALIIELINLFGQFIKLISVLERGPHRFLKAIFSKKFARKSKGTTPIRLF